jgi:hypothetical protein
MVSEDIRVRPIGRDRGIRWNLPVKWTKRNWRNRNEVRNLKMLTEWFAAHPTPKNRKLRRVMTNPSVAGSDEFTAFDPNRFS